MISEKTMRRFDDARWNSLDLTKKMFSNNTVKDIENIINTIAGEFVEEPLNPFVCHVVEQTQKPEFHKMLVKQAAINNTIIEKEQKDLFDKEKDIMVDESLWESVEFEK